MSYNRNTGRFIMFSVIAKIYNKKTKGPTLMELFTATGKLKKFFLTTRDVRCVHHGWHCTHRYDIQVVATHASACVLCTQASQVTICSHNTDNVLYELYVSTLNQMCNFS